MSHNQGRPHWPPTFKPGGVVSPAPQRGSPPGINVSLGSGVVERKVQLVSAPPVHRPREAPQPSKPKRSVAPGPSRQHGPPAVYKPNPPPQLLQTKVPVAALIGRQPGPAPPIYRPDAQHRGPVRPADRLVQRQPNPGLKVPKAGQQSAYAVQAPVPLRDGVQEIRVGLPGSAGPAGSVRLRPADSGKVYISDLEVAPEHRRQGVASMLVQAALRAVVARGHKGAVLEAMPGTHSISSQSLVSMYQKLGFRQTGLSGRGKPLMEFGPSQIQMKKSNGSPAAVPSRIVIQRSLQEEAEESGSGELEEPEEIPVWPYKMRDKISSSTASAMHGEKQKKLPRWLAYVSDRSNPDLVISKGQDEDQEVVWVRLDLITEDGAASAAAKKTGGTVVKDRAGHYYGYITSV